jgi:WD40 repeat protein
VKLWRAPDQKLLLTFDAVRSPEGVFHPPALSPDGSLVAAGATNEIRLFQTSDGNLSRVITGHVGTVNSVCFSADGTLLASGGADSTIKFWRVADSTLVRTIVAYSNSVDRVLLSPDGTTIASAGRHEPGPTVQEIRLWRLPDGAFVRIVEAQSFGGPITFAFSPDGSLLATPIGCAPNNWCIRLSRVSDGAFLPQIAHGDAAWMTDMAFSLDGSKIVVTVLAPGQVVGGYIHIFDVSDGSRLQLIRNDLPDWPPSSPAQAATFSPDGTVVLIGTGAGTTGDNTFKKWQVSNGAPLPRPTGHQFPITSMALSPDGRRLVTAGASSIGGMVELKCWNAADGTLLWSSNNFYSAATDFSPNGSVLAIGGYSQIDLLNPTNGMLMRTLTSGATDVDTISFSPAGALLASGGGLLSGELVLWRVSDGAMAKNLTGHTSRVTAVAFSPDGATLASASVDKTARLWRVTDGALLRTLTNHTERVNAVAFAPDGALLASGSSDRTVRLWRVSDGIQVATLDGHSGEVKAIAFSNDGRILLSGCGATSYPPVSGQEIRAWRVSDGTLLHVFNRESVSVNAITVSPDGRRFAYGRDDATVVMAYAPLWITDVARTNGQFVFHWQGGSGLYQVQQCTHLNTNSWENLVVPASSNNFTNSSPLGTVFYRIQSLLN